MATTLAQLLQRKNPGRLAVVENMQQLSSTWKTLKLTNEEQEKWNIICNPRAHPMIIELIHRVEIQNFSEEYLQKICVMYGGTLNKNDNGEQKRERMIHL